MVFSEFSAPVVFHRQIIGEDQWHEQLQQVSICPWVSVVTGLFLNISALGRWNWELWRKPKLFPAPSLMIHCFLSLFSDKAKTQRNHLDYSKVSLKRVSSPTRCVQGLCWCANPSPRFSLSACSHTSQQNTHRHTHSKHPSVGFVKVFQSQTEGN